MFYRFISENFASYFEAGDPNVIYAQLEDSAIPEAIKDDAIESSANDYPSEVDIKELFADFDITSNCLGNTVADKNARLAARLLAAANQKTL